MEEQVKERKQIKVSDILIDLENGLTRLKSEDFGCGSIEEKYELTVGEVKELFRHPKLWKRKTKRLGNGLSFDIVDDLGNLEDEMGDLTNVYTIKGERVEEEEKENN